MSNSNDDTPPIDLEELRSRIDILDQALIEVLGERAKLVVEVGRTKRQDGTPIYAPDREKRVLERALQRHHDADGPLPDRTIEAIYRELMSGSFSLELPLKIGYLGPPGTFSHVAAVSHFGSSVELVELPAIDAVFEEVAAGRAHYGLVPYENSVGGSVIDTLDSFREHQVTIYAEAQVEVNQSLLANCPFEEIREIHSKPQAFAQCRRWLQDRLPSVECIPRASTALAVQSAANTSGVAAVGSPFAGELHGVNVLCERISDKPNNITRFLVIARESALPTGEDRTTILFSTNDSPGALVGVLNAFRDSGVNLSHIDKRPSGRENWQYTFFIDALGHLDDDSMRQAITAASEHCVELKVLGSYPMSQRVL
jgi:chorismate mutase/prephenate dehydratase